LTVNSSRYVYLEPSINKLSTAPNNREFETASSTHWILEVK
jgi:hypothetical protein